MSTEGEAASATGTARHVSRLVRAAGLPMANTKDRYRWTEGFHVWRIGYSAFVGVSYHIVGHYVTDETRARRDAAVAQAREVLKAAGYEQDEHGTIDSRKARTK